MIEKFFVCLTMAMLVLASVGIAWSMRKEAFYQKRQQEVVVEWLLLILFSASAIFVLGWVAIPEFYDTPIHLHQRFTFYEAR